MSDFIPIDLDMSLDDIDDLPSFGAWPTGAYKVKYAYEIKDIGEHKNSVGITITCLEIKQLGEEPDVVNYPEPKAGDTTNMLFMTDNAIGAGFLKAFLKPIKDKFGTTSVRETLEAGSKEVEFLMILKRDADKKDASKHYMRIKEMAVV